MDNISLFSYSAGTNFLYRVTPGIKMLFFYISVVSMFFFNTLCCFLFLLFIWIFSLCVDYSVKELINNQKSIFSYYIIIIFVSCFSFSSLEGTSKKIFEYLYFNYGNLDNTLRVILRLMNIVSISSIFFKTTTSFQIRSTLDDFEFFFIKCLNKIPFLNKFHLEKKIRFAYIFSLYLTFIPRVFSVYSSVSLAWKARCGKNNLKKLFIVLPAVVSVLLSVAKETDLSFKNRK